MINSQLQYNAVIIDDEQQQQEALMNMLEDQHEIKVVKICSSVDEGKSFLLSHSVDLVFLDVVMPPSNGFEILKALPVINFETIFTTSHESYAIQAFKVAAVDYLLKPFGKEDLSIALSKFKEKVQLKKKSEHIQALLMNLKKEQSESIRLALPVLSGFTFVDTSDIIRCESDNTYTTFFMQNQKPIIVSRTLKECEQLLSDHGFVRIHNSHLINLLHVREYIRGEGGQVKMSDQTVVDVSRRRKDELLDKMNRL